MFLVSIHEINKRHKSMTNFMINKRLTLKNLDTKINKKPSNSFGNTKISV